MLVHAHRGETDEADRRVAIFVPRAREIGDPQMLGPALAHAALVSAVSGRLEEATGLLEEFERVSGSLWLSKTMPTAVRVCVAAGSIGLAEALLDRATDAAPNPVLLQSLTAARGALAEVRGQKDEAASLYAEAAGGWGQLGYVVERGYALLGLGRCGDAAALREGPKIFEQLRAIPLTAIAA